MRLGVLVVCLALLGSSCSLFVAKIYPQWSEGQVKTDSESVLYDVVHISLQRAGYPVGVGADKGKRKLVTGWYVSEAPFKGKGYRQKATVHYTPTEEGVFLIRVRVQRETNESFRPLDPGAAKWEEDEDNPEAARIILQYVTSFLAGDDLEVGPKQTPNRRD